MLDRYGLHMRAALFRLIRKFFYEKDFLEVDTPLRQPVIIPESTIRPLIAEGQYLHTSPELSMKRLLAGGVDNIFQLCPCFRKDERGSRHLEEFWMLEWYRRDSDYLELMDDCRQLLVSLFSGLMEAQKVLGKEVELFAGIDLSTQRDWPRLRVADGFSRFAPVSLDEALASDRFDEILVEYVEPQLGLGVPEFFYDYPVELGSLAKVREDDPALVERFELYMSGVEIANGFSELTDSIEQRHRFELECKRIASLWGEQMVMPERFLAELEQLDRAAGIALGVDRLFMLAVNATSIAAAVPFAQKDFL